MKRVYYGICNTESDTLEKRVNVSDNDLSSEGFKEGDLLVVFFAQQNDIKDARLVVYVGDTEVEVSTTDDPGGFIKAHDVEGIYAGSWCAGETVIFCYTQLNTQPSTYYWEMVEAGQATTELYGVTKLFNIDSATTFKNWLTTGKPAPNPENQALAPEMLRKLFQAVQGLLEDEEQQQQPISIGLNWEPASGSGVLTTLGNLSLEPDGNPVTIQYYKEDNSNIITHTGQLVNNGNGGDGQGQETAMADPFITKRVPDDLFFTNGTDEQGHPIDVGIKADVSDTQKPRITFKKIITPSETEGGPETISNAIRIGNTEEGDRLKIYLDNVTSTVAPFHVLGADVIKQDDNGIHIAKGERNILTKPLTAPSLAENGTSLENKYSGKLRVIRLKSPRFTVGAGKSSGHKYFELQNYMVDNWVPIGVVGYNTDYSDTTATGDAKWANVWECHLFNNNSHPNTVQYALYNLSTKQVAVSFEVDVLFIKDLGDHYVVGPLNPEEEISLTNPQVTYNL